MPTFKQLPAWTGVFISIFLCHFANADPWRLVMELPEASVYVDAGAVRAEGSYFSFAGKTKFQDGSEQFDGYFVRCDSKLVALHTSLRYDSLGNNTSNVSIPRNQLRAHPTPSGTPLAAQVNYVCAGQVITDRNSPNPASAAADPKQKKPVEDKKASSGSGVIVGNRGEILTNHHVVSECGEIIAKSSYGTAKATITAIDPKLDIALLKTNLHFTSTIAFRGTPSASPGETVVALGYPLSGLLASEVNVSVGVISALAGLSNDITRIQVSTPVQPGNSGGPLLDVAGNLVGIVVSKLDALRVAKITGDIPQNINFAIKSEIIRLFLDANHIPVKTISSNLKQDASFAASRGRGLTVQIICH